MHLRTDPSELSIYKSSPGKVKHEQVATDDVCMSHVAAPLAGMFGSTCNRGYRVGAEIQEASDQRQALTSGACMRNAHAGSIVVDMDCTSMPRSNRNS